MPHLLSLNRSDLTIKQGSSFRRIITVKNTDGTPVDLTDNIVKSEIRKTHDAITVVQAITTEILLPETNGEIQLSLTPTETSNLDFEGTNFVYDLVVRNTITGDVIRILEGRVILALQVTRL